MLLPPLGRGSTGVCADAEDDQAAECEGRAGYLVREAVLRLDILGSEPAPVLVGGGAIRTRGQAQLRADMLGKPISVSVEPDVSLRGVAMLALVGAGEYADLGSAHQALTSGVRDYHPDPRRSGRYAELFAIWRIVRTAIYTAADQHAPCLESGI